MSDSEVSFEYDDDDDDILFVLETNAGDPNDVAVPPRRSGNALSSKWYRPLRVSWYIQEHFVSKARGLHDSIMPFFSIAELLVMFHHKKWLVDELTGAYYDDSMRLQSECGLTKGRAIQSTVTALNFTCSICCESYRLAQVFGLLCGHIYCATCYGHYIQLELPRGQLIRCIEPDCDLSLLHEEAETLLPLPITPASVLIPAPTCDSDESGDSDDEYDHQFDHVDLSGRLPVKEPEEPLLRNRLLVAAAKAAIDTNHSRYRWCPSLDCNGLVELTTMRQEEDGVTKDKTLADVTIVQCPSAHEFCFECQYENHLPCTCLLVGRWIKRCEDDLETANWIDANAKSCPRCHLQIEKNGGCNHMTCRKCAYEFCWICLDDWIHHKTTAWRCNRYDAREVEEVKKKRSDSQTSLNRYLHFFKRFSVHQRSMQGDDNTLRSVHRCMLMYMKAQLHTERTVSWNDVQFLSDAIRSLTSGRKTLMWTYAFAFYLKSNNHSMIFEGMQDYLNKTVEDLSRLFEEINGANTESAVKRITKRKTEIVNLAALVTRRQQLLIECAHSGVEQKMLEFSNI